MTNTCTLGNYQILPNMCKYRHGIVIAMAYLYPGDLSLLGIAVMLLGLYTMTRSINFSQHLNAWVMHHCFPCLCLHNSFRDHTHFVLVIYRKLSTGFKQNAAMYMYINLSCIILFMCAHVLLIDSHSQLVLVFRSVLYLHPLHPFQVYQEDPVNPHTWRNRCVIRGTTRRLHDHTDFPCGPLNPSLPGMPSIPSSPSVPLIPCTGTYT